MMDAYTLRARIAPVALLGIPAFALLGAVGVSPASFGLVTAGVAGATALVAAGQVAERGRALQARLFASWGGAPTTCALSLIESDDHDRVDSRRAAVERFAGLQLPTADDERANPERTRTVLDDAVANVRARLREDDTNRILADANADYGFRRNCLAIRDAGIGVSAGGVLAGSALWISSSGGTPSAYLASSVASGVLAGFWWRTVTVAWVRSAATRYTTQFYETLMRTATPR